MYTLYYSPGAASMAVHLFLIEARLPHHLERMDLHNQQHKSAEYLALNPNGLVPTLLVDGKPMYESAALLLYLADRHSEIGFAPALLAPQRRPYLQWLMHCANTLQPAFRNWFYPGEVAGENAVEDVKDEAQRRIEAAWARIDEHLRNDGPCLAGGQYSAADMLLTMLMRWSRNMPRPATEWPALRMLAERVRQRPAWNELYRREMLSEWL